MPARGVAAASEYGLPRRQPPPGNALLVLATRLPVPPSRRRPLPRSRRRTPRARDLRERVLRLGPSVGRRGGTRRARRTPAHEPTRARRRGALPPTGRGRPQNDAARERGAAPRDRAAAGRGECLREGDGPEAVVVPAGGRRRSTSRRRLDTDRARRCRADSVADRADRGSRRRDAAAPYRVEGAARASARAPRARRARVIAGVVLAAGASSRYGTEPPKQVALLPQVLGALGECSIEV